MSVDTWHAASHTCPGVNSDAYIWYGTHNHAKWAAANGDHVYQYLFQFKGPYG